MPTSSESGGLGAALVGEKIVVNHRHVSVSKLLGEGGFSYVYLVKEISDVSTGGSLSSTVHGDSVSRSSGGRSGSLGNGSGPRRQGSMGRSADGKAKEEMVLKVTSILSRQQRDIAEKEAKLLSRLSHPSIIKMYDTCYRTIQKTGKSSKRDDDKNKERPMHLILMEFCEGGQALDVCTELAKSGERFDLSTLIIAFGQICNAVSYLHAQRPPIVHRDLKPANFLVKNGAYKLCDFGSAVFGHVEVKTPQQRVDAEEVIAKTTTQMFRAPEMVDLHMAKKLTQATDVWALGACLYSMAFLQNCFEEGSNLAILNRKYKIPDDNPYGDGLVELLDRMLTVDSKARADMTEIILCLSAVYSGRPLPPRKERSSKGSSSSSKKEKESSSSSKSKKKSERTGTFRTDGQGIGQEDLTLDSEEVAKTKTATKLNPNSAAFRRRQAASAEIGASTHSANGDAAAAKTFGDFDANDSFFASADTGDETSDDNLNFGSFDDNGAAGSTDAAAAWGNLSEKDMFASFDPDVADIDNAFGGTSTENGESGDKATASDKDDDGDKGDIEAPGTPAKTRTRSAPERRRSSQSVRQSRSIDQAARSPGRSTHHRRRSGSRERRRSSSKGKDDSDKDGGGEGEITLDSLQNSLVAASEDSNSKPKESDRRRSSRSAPGRSLSTSKHSADRSGRRSRPGQSTSRRDASGDAAKKISASALSFD